MLVKSLRFDPNLYICEPGYVFRIQQGVEVKIPIRRKKYGAPYFWHDGKIYDLFNLMVEAFIGPIKYTDSVRYAVNKFHEIPLNSIIVKPFTGKYELSPEEEKVLHDYKCDFKAWAANARSCGSLLTPLHVYTSLKVHGFRCFYCNSILQKVSWQLDHYYPLSTNGKNSFENIVPACRRCNSMKHNMDPIAFVKKCKKIASIFDHSNGELVKIKFMETKTS